MERTYTLWEYAQEPDSKLHGVYIAGPVSMLSHDTAWKNFEDARKRLESEGFARVINPMSVCSRSWEYGRCMRACVQMVADSDTKAIYMLRWWWLSRGARLERRIAKTLGLAIIYERI